MFLSNFHNSFGLKKIFNSDFKLFQTSIWIHSFSSSLVSIFIPIILLQLGYSVGEIMIYFFLYYTFDVPLNFLAKWLTAKFGARKVIILGTISAMAYFLGIFFLNDSNWYLLFWIALFAALYDVFYWIAHIYYFMQTSQNDENVSGDVSASYIVRKIAEILAPLLGALVLIFLGNKFLLGFSIIIMFVSVLPLFYLKNSLDKPKEVMEIRKFFSSWEIIKDYVYTGIFSIHRTIEQVIWPMFIFIIFSNVESVAFLPVIVSITYVIFAYFSGKINRDKRYQTIAIGGLFLALIWISRFFLEQYWAYYVSVFFASIFSIIISLPIDSIIFEKGEKKDVLLTSTFRNFSHMFCGALVYGFLAVAINVFDVGFITASLSMFSLVLLIFMSSVLGSKKFAKATVLKN